MRLFLITVLCGLTFACAQTPEMQNNPNITPTPDNNAIANLVIAEPLVNSFQSQRAIAQLNQIVLNTKLSEEERAQMFFRRGLLYDSVGLNALAFYDFTQAIRLQPDIPGVYNSLGIQHTLRGDFIEAYEAFDSTLEIDPSYHFAYLNRALASYYDKRYELSLSDINAFYATDTSDTYRILWRYLIQYRIDPKAALHSLENAKSGVSTGAWTIRLIDFYLGEITQSDLLGDLLLGLENQKQLSERLCEVYFYLGKYYADRDQPAVAKNFFKLALATNVFEFVEHRYARLELELLHQHSPSDTKIAENE